MSTHIRQAVPADYDSVRAICAQTLPGHEDTSRAEFDTAALNWREQRCPLNVAVDDTGVIGYAALGPYPGGGGSNLHSTGMLLHQIAVRDDHQGNSVGSSLLARTLASATALGAGLVFAAVNDASAGFYTRRGWTVGESGWGLAFVGQECKEDAGARGPGDVVGVFLEAAKVRGGCVDIEGGFDRLAYIVTDPDRIRLATHYPPNPADPSQGPILGLVGRIAEDPELIFELPISTVFMVIGDLMEILGRGRAAQLVAAWLLANPEDAIELPRRMQLPALTADEIMGHLFSAN